MTYQPEALDEYDVRIWYSGGTVLAWSYTVNGPGLPKPVLGSADTLWGARFAVWNIKRRTRKVRLLGLDVENVARPR